MVEKMNLTLKQVKSLIEQEIAWSNSNESHRGEDFRRGFVSGLRQALMLITEGEKDIRQALENSQRQK